MIGLTFQRTKLRRNEAREQSYGESKLQSNEQTGEQSRRGAKLKSNKQTREQNYRNKARQ